MLDPVTDADGAPFWEYAARGELRVQACADCGELRFPPRPCCPHCQSFDERVAPGVRPGPDLVVRRPASTAAARLRGAGAVQRDRGRAGRGAPHPAGRQPGQRGPGAARASLDPARHPHRRPGARAVFHDGLPQWVPERP